MAATNAKLALGSPAPDFRLPATDGKTYALADVAGPKGTVIAFICNHCPYVKAVVDRLVQDAAALKAEGVGFAAICSNDARSHPQELLSQHEALRRDAQDSPSPISTTRTSRWRGPMARCARPTFSVSMPPASLPTAAASTKAAPARHPRVRAASWSRRCAPLPKRARGRRSRTPRWDAPSSGRRREVEGRGHSLSLHPIKWIKRPRVIHFMGLNWATGRASWLAATLDSSIYHQHHHRRRPARRAAN